MLVHKGDQIKNVQLITGVRIKIIKRGSVGAGVDLTQNHLKLEKKTKHRRKK